MLVFWAVHRPHAQRAHPSTAGMRSDLPASPWVSCPLMSRPCAACATWLVLYRCLGTWFGKAQPQNKKAHLIGHVRVRLSDQAAPASLVHSIAMHPFVLALQDVHSGDGLKDPVNRIYS